MIPGMNSLIYRSLLLSWSHTAFYYYVSFYLCYLVFPTCL